MQVTGTRLIAAAGLAGVLALAATQVSSAASTSAASPGRAAAAETGADAAAKRAAAAQDQRGSTASPGDAAAKRAAAARHSDPSPADAAAKRAAAAREPGTSLADVADKRAAAAQAGQGSGRGNLLLEPDAASSIARSLGVSESAVVRALRTLVPLSEANGGLDPTSGGFRAAAAQAGVTPAQLAGAISALKMAG